MISCKTRDLIIKISLPASIYPDRPPQVKAVVGGVTNKAGKEHSYQWLWNSLSKLFNHRNLSEMIVNMFDTTMKTLVGGRIPWQNGLI